MFQLYSNPTSQPPWEGLLYARVLEKRVWLIVETWLQDEQWDFVLAVKLWTSSTPSAWCSRVHCRWLNWSMCFLALEKAFNHVLWGPLLRAFRFLYKQGVRPAMSALDWTCSQCILDSSMASLCQQSCLYSLWTQFLSADKGLKGSGWGASGFCPCCLLKIRFC